MLQLNPRGAAKPQLSAAQLQMEKKMNEPASGQEPTKVSQVESPEAKGGLPEERSCLAEISVTSTCSRSSIFPRDCAAASNS